MTTKTFGILAGVAGLIAAIAAPFALRPESADGCAPLSPPEITERAEVSVTWDWWPPGWRCTYRSIDTGHVIRQTKA